MKIVQGTGRKNRHEQFLKKSQWNTCFKISHSCLAALKKKKIKEGRPIFPALFKDRKISSFGLQCWTEILQTLIASSNCLQMSVTIHRCCWQCFLQKDLKQIEKPLFWYLKPCICTQTHTCVEIYINFKKNILIALKKKKLVSASWNVFLYIVIISLITSQMVRTIFSPQCITID